MPDMGSNPLRRVQVTFAFQVRSPAKNGNAEYRAQENAFDLQIFSPSDFQLTHALAQIALGLAFCCKTAITRCLPSKLSRIFVDVTCDVKFKKNAQLFKSAHQLAIQKDARSF